MEQVATVLACSANGMAEVLCPGTSPCSGNCAQCGGCRQVPDRTVMAANPIGAKPGDRIVLQAAAGWTIGAAAAVYLVPAVFLLAGAWLAGLWGALTGFALGMAAAVPVDRRMRRRGPVFTICAFAPAETEQPV